MDEEEKEKKLSEEDRKKVLVLWVISLAVTIIFSAPSIVLLLWGLLVYINTVGKSEMGEIISLYYFIIPSSIGIAFGILSVVFGILFLRAGYIKAVRKKYLFLVVAWVLDLPTLIGPVVILLLILY